MYLNGANCEFFESVASFLTENSKEEIFKNYKNNKHALKSVRRQFPVLMGAYSYLLGVELKREEVDIELPVSCAFKSLKLDA